MKQIKKFIVGGGFMGLLALGGLWWWRNAHITEVERGRRLAQELGCFTCHGPEGRQGTPNPGSRWETVPAWDGGTLKMFAQNEEEILEWILDGAPKRLRDSDTWQKEQGQALIHMPAYRRWLNQKEARQVAAYVLTVGEWSLPQEPKAKRGFEVASKMGCFSCHGPGGRGTSPNPGSLKGYIPSWDGQDFPELVKNDEELREWILEGSARRLLQNPMARFFLEHQATPMPPFKGVVSEEELETLVAYIQWLRRSSHE